MFVASATPLEPKCWVFFGKERKHVFDSRIAFCGELVSQCFLFCGMFWKAVTVKLVWLCGC